MSNEPQDTTANHELVELLDRVIDTGVVVSGDVRLSVAGVELIYINLRALIASSDRVIEEQVTQERVIEESAPHVPNQPTPKTDTTEDDTYKNNIQDDNTHEET